MTPSPRDFDPIEPLLPTTGWLGQYLAFTSSLQACARFKFFSACCVLGALISNKVYIQRGDPDLLPKLFPNVWVLVLGPPGRGSKTQTINQAVNALTEASTLTRILSDKLTPESLVKALAEPLVGKDGSIKIGDATGLIKAPEASVLFGRQQYTVGMISLIADLYDYRPEWTSETITRGKNTLYNNCISILAGSTPDWLQTQLPQDAFTGGFMSRFVIVEIPFMYDKRVGWPKSPDKDGWVKVVAGLKEFQGLRGEFRWTREAKDHFIKDYESLRPTGDTQNDAYLVRSVEQILKIGMLLSLSNNPNRLVLEEEYYLKAKNILKVIHPETKRPLSWSCRG